MPLAYKTVSLIALDLYLIANYSAVHHNLPCYRRIYARKLIDLQDLNGGMDVILEFIKDKA